jgi:hypothetical protein
MAVRLPANIEPSLARRLRTVGKGLRKARATVDESHLTDLAATFEQLLSIIHRAKAVSRGRKGGDA